MGPGPAIVPAMGSRGESAERPVSCLRESRSRGSARAVLRWLLGAAIGIPLAAAPASADPGQDAGIWFKFKGEGALLGISEKTRWWLDSQVRIRDDEGGFHQGVVRPGIGYAMTESVTLWGGYAWVRTEPEDKVDSDEHRIWQQITWRDRAEDFSFRLRTRFEQRFEDSENDVGLRLRGKLGVRYRLLDPSDWSVVLWNEIMFNLNDADWGPQSGFDQNRLFAGFAWHLGGDERVSLEMGYLNQVIDRSRGDSDEMVHVLSLGILFE